MASQQEPPSPVIFLEKTEHRLDQPLTPLVHRPGRLGRHQLSVSSQFRFVFADFYGSTVGRSGAFPKGRAGATQRTIGPVASESVAVRMSECVLEDEGLLIRAQVGVVLRVIREVVLVVWGAASAFMGVRHEHAVSGGRALGKVGP